MFEIENVKCVFHTKNELDEIKALKVRGDFFGNAPVWVPYYAVHDDSPVWRKGDVGTLIIKDDFAEEKGWL
jgi:hypothetical protein